jgi:hypothetical protein
VIDLGSEQLVEHLHGGGEEHAHVGLYYFVRSVGMRSTNVNGTGSVSAI